MDSIKKGKRKNLLRYSLILFYVVLLVSNLSAQTEGILQYNWTDTINIPARGNGARYSDVWGFTNNNMEYAVIGSTLGTHFINVTDPTNSFEESFVKGKFFGKRVIHRDYHDYKGYLYAVCDQGTSSLQVIDIRQLPDTTIVVYEDSVNIVRSHNVFVDSISAMMYTVGNRKADGNDRIPIQIWSLENPALPVLINNVFEINGVNIDYVHDLYARGDTVYMNSGTQGLFVADFSDPINPVLLGALSMYEDAGYNHSGWLNERGDRYYMADETWGKDIKIVDVTNLSQMRVIKLIHAESDPEGSVVHNLVVKNDMLFVSYYFDGLQVFDIGDDDEPCRAYSYSTSSWEPQAGRYRGAWGVYPFLPSENILVTDMEEGLFVIQLPTITDVDTSFNEGTPICSPLTDVSVENFYEEVFMSYNPTNYDYTLMSSDLSGELKIYNSQGIVVFENNLRGFQEFKIPRDRLNGGIHFVVLVKNDRKRVFKVNLF